MGLRIRREKGQIPSQPRTRGCTQAWLNHFCIWPNRLGRTSYSVNILSRHMNAPSDQHWLRGKRLLQYLHGWKGLEPTYTKEACYDLVGKVMQTGLVI